MAQLRSKWLLAWAGFASWTMLCGMAPPTPAPRLTYASLDLTGGAGQVLTRSAAVLPLAEVGGVAAARPLASVVRSGAAAWRLSVDAGVTADSNINNAGTDRFIPFLSDGGTIPVEIDPAYRARSGSGRSVGVSGGVKLRLSDGMAVAVDAEGQATDYKGKRNDDISYLLAAGPELTWGSGGSASFQAVAAQSWYGGTSYQAGLGFRGRVQTAVGAGQRVSFSLDALKFNSGYGRDFGGTRAGAYLGYSAVLDPVMTASLGLYARRDWLRSDAYSSLELGAYGGVTRYLSEGVTGSLTAGVSRSRYAAPLAYLSPDRRQDWRFSFGAQLTARHPLAMGFTPTLSYSYNRTDGSIDFFDTRRHRVRIGVLREF